jgi:hypothetical protein
MSLELSATVLPSLQPFTSPDFIKKAAVQSTPGRHSSPSVQPEQAPQPIADRRRTSEPKQGGERRQFGSSHANLTPAAAELARAIDSYKLEHRRRYITCEEMLVVITQLGYSR